ncbi:MAG: sterol desaturase family protein [Bdellovibrionota bacterium]
MFPVQEILDKLFKDIRREVLGLLTAPIQGGSHLYWLFLLIFVGLSALSYWRYEKKDDPFSLKSFLSWLFSKKVYFHPSAIVDYKVIVAAAVMGPLCSLLFAGVSSYLAVGVSKGLVAFFGPPSNQAPWTPWSILFGTVALGMTIDFTTYLAHMIHHRVPLLWEIHKIHHSAEVLTPITLFRKHPLEEPLFSVIAAPILALFQGVIAYQFAGKMTLVTLFGGNFIYSLFRFAGANLRHSHVWLAWPPWLSRIFLSPAQHQIHHSVDEKHLDKNYGEIFAIWDWLFGSLYVPRKKENLVFGIGKGIPQEYPTLLDVYWVPLRNMGRMVFRRKPELAKRPRT